MFKEVSEEEDRIGREVVNAAFQVHKELGPGLLEKVYEVCFCYVLAQKGFEIKRQIDIPIVFDGLIFEEGLRLVVMVNDLVICELKALNMELKGW
jgi:GxxExxY protein